MQIVIDIPVKMYHMINAGFYDYGDMNVIIQNGTPLPEHHGKLFILDENLVKQHLVPFDCSNNLWINEVGVSLSTIKTIPATEGEENGSCN